MYLPPRTARVCNPNPHLSLVSRPLRPRKLTPSHQYCPEVTQDLPSHPLESIHNNTVHGAGDANPICTCALHRSTNYPIICETEVVKHIHRVRWAEPLVEQAYAQPHPSRYRSTPGLRIASGGKYSHIHRTLPSVHSVPSRRSSRSSLGQHGSPSRSENPQRR
jgi:hypothetical protein